MTTTVTKIPVKYIDSTEYKLTIYPDECSESPESWGNYTIHVFSSNSEYLDDNLDLTKEAKKMLKDGVAFMIDKYEHGNVRFSLAGEGMQCRWDNARNYGMIIFEDEYIKGTDYNTRKEYARGDLEDYSNWCNGEVYSYILEDSRGNIIDSCNGYYDEAHLIADAKNAIPGAININIVYEWGN